MKLICDRAKMSEAFAKAAMFTARQSHKPILQMVKIEANGKTTLLATDLEVGCRINCEGVQVQKPGSAMLPVDRIGGLLKEATDETITIEATKDKITAKTSRGSFSLPPNDVDEFPDVVVFDHKAPHFEMEAAAFCAGLKLVTFATDADSSRYALGCVMLDQDGSAMHLIATDGRRAARFQFPCHSGDHKPSVDTIIRDSQLVRVARGLHGESLKIHVRDNDVLFACGDSEFYARMTQGRFPQWRKLGWDSGDHVFTTIAGQLQATLRQAALVLGNGKEDSRSLDLTLDGGTLKVTSEIAERGNAEVEMPVSFDGPKHVATLDYDYLNDWLAAVGPEASIEFDPSNGKERLMMRAFDGTAQYLLMPLDKDQ